MYAEIVVNHPSRAVDRVFDYKIPDEFLDKVFVGSRVAVPFSRYNTPKEGFVLRIKQKTDAGSAIKSIIRIISDTPAFKPDIVELIEYMHNRYLSPYIDIINAIVPSGTSRQVRMVTLAITQAELDEFVNKSRSEIQKRMLSILRDTEKISTADLVKFSGGNYQALGTLVKKGIVKYYDISVERSVYNTDGSLEQAPVPTDEQRNVITEINDALNAKEPTTMLLHGVTGSGKTEVFLRTIEHTINMGRAALVLVPEISLTPQMLSRFVSRFGRRIAILHSGLSVGERFDQWSRIMNNDADIVIGARSAVFAPLSNIGLIIIDEEHSDTYKSEMSPRYHAREVAIKRSQQHNAVTLLASATPSIESYSSALSGEYKLLRMEKRYNQASMPKIEIVDMRDELESGNKSMFSKSLYEAIKQNLLRKEQTILFMNRRGFSTFVSCRKCGFVPQCPNCNISLTYHSYDNSLKCHYCGHKQPNYTVCPACGSKYIRYFGGGTQRVEDEINRLFTDATTIRLDADATTRKNSHKDILTSFVEDKIDIMIGTQMVSKGLDFSNVTLVGVMSADTMLHINDFRSGERTFNILEQVSGRAGRGDKPGRAIIQTYNPDNFAVDLVKTHDYLGFYNKTIEERRIMWYPPYSEMVSVRFSGEDNETTRRSAFMYKDAFGDINKIPVKIAILGPIPSGISKIKNKYRWQILIKCENADIINDRLLTAMDKVRSEKTYNEILIQIDKNPMNIY